MSASAMRYKNTKPAPGERVVHNFPANGRKYGVDGFRYWTEPTQGAEGGPRLRCFCYWTAVVPEHYGTVVVVSEDGEHRHVRDLDLGEGGEKS